MSVCESVHPENGMTCERPPGNHPEHSHYDTHIHGLIRWPNLDYKPTLTKRLRRSGKAAQASLDRLADKLRP